MSSKMKVLNPGLLTTIQDKGRIAYQKEGITVAGAMDIYSLQLANILLGNDRFEAGLEITVIGPKLLFTGACELAITGADITAKINGQEIAMFTSIPIKKNDDLQFSKIKNGCRAYLAVTGGFAVPKVMGSRATDLLAEIGGYKGRKLLSGDIIPINRENKRRNLRERKVPLPLILEYKEISEIRVIIGPDKKCFSHEGLETFLTSEYTLSNQCNRTGYRLEGPKIKHKDGADIISVGINMGTIQVPAHGLPIIMMADRPTIGGYTKIANVISYDLPLLAQLKPGDKIKFKKIGIEEAHDLVREQEERLLNIINNFNK